MVPPKEPIGYWKSTLEGRPEFVNAIGMISIENANLEAALADLLAGVLNVRDDVGRAIYFEPRAAILRIDILDAAAKSRFRPKQEEDRFYENEAGKAEALKEVADIVRRAKSAVGRRHEVIHDAWGIDDDSGEVMRAAHPAEGHLEDINTLNVLIADIRGVVTTAKNLRRKWRHHSPTLIDLRLEPRDKSPG